MLPVFISPSGEVLDTRKVKDTPRDEVGCDPWNMAELARVAAIEADKASTRKAS